MAEIVALPVPTTERTKRLFDWAATVLADLGLVKAVAQATSLAELRGITLNIDAPIVALYLPLKTRVLIDALAAHITGILPEGKERK